MNSKQSSFLIFLSERNRTVFSWKLSLFIYIVSLINIFKYLLLISNGYWSEENLSNFNYLVELKNLWHYNNVFSEAFSPKVLYIPYNMLNTTHTLFNTISTKSQNELQWNVDHSFSRVGSLRKIKKINVVFNSWYNKVFF